MKTVQRRRLLEAGIALAAVPIAGRASADPTPPAALKAGLTRVIARVGKNHGHVFVVPLADVVAGVDKTYDLKGSAPHPHALTITADQMRLLASGEIVRARSTEVNAHAHRVWVRCAPATDPPEWVSAVKATFTGKDEHEIVVPAADLASTTDKTYDVQGIAGHNHQITLTAEDFATLRKGFPVGHHTTRLPDDSHMHGVTIEVLSRKG